MTTRGCGDGDARTFGWGMNSEWADCHHFGQQSPKMDGPAVVVMGRSDYVRFQQHHYCQYGGGAIQRYHLKNPVNWKCVVGKCSPSN